MDYTPDVKITELGGDFYDAVSAADFPKTQLRFRNDAAAKIVGLDGLNDEDWLSHFGRFTPLAGNIKKPLALRYHGHQFRNYNPDIGDGRGFLFAQLRDEKGRLLDLGTKGSGRTPYSRMGDGRLTLLGGVREVLATTYLQSLGVETSKSFSLIETGESLERHDEPSPTRAAVLTRLSHSHIRFGTFQRQYFEDELVNLQSLTDYCLRHYYADITDKTPVGLLRAVAKNSAQTVASWMAAGFVHGVMNTDNMNITGESFDYGPYRFLPTLQSDFTAAYFDHSKLYAFSKQPEAMYWNLAQLANCLSLIDDEKRLLGALEDFPKFYRDALIEKLFSRLGIAPSGHRDQDAAFVMKTFEFLEKSQAGWPQFFHDFNGGLSRENLALGGLNQEAYTHPDFADWRLVFSQYKIANAAPKTDIPASLIYEQIGALWKPIDSHDDWSAFRAKLDSFNPA
ncbi:MAG: YdiU family protein [Robiginitomaculum sp.]